MNIAAIDREGGEVSFAIAEQPSKGTVTLDGALAERITAAAKH